MFVLEKPIELAAGTVLTFYLTQNHGGWNSDDNQNNNLGRFRLSITTAADAEADPLPAAVRAILAIPTTTAPTAQKAAVFSLLAHDRPRMEATPTTGSRPSGKSIPTARRSSS